jgi:putative pyruvate formate lyase activating enzyme
VFFSGCELGCVFCQNREISRGNFGREVTEARLAEIFLELQAQDVHNINLVTPLQYTPQIISALELARPALTLPVVVNCGGYARVETLQRWQGKADVWLPDLKYHSSELSARYSGAADYFDRATEAILEMHRQQPKLEWNADGTLRRGVIVRHLILPGAWKDSLKVLEWLDSALPKDGFLLSLMRQYTPTEACKDYPEINRKLTTFEYRKVLDRAAELGFGGFSQEADSAKAEYTPAFDLTGVEL